MDKLTQMIEGVTNPVSAAKNTIEAARGVVNEGYGFVEDVRAIAEKEAERREKKREAKEVAPSSAELKATQQVAKRQVSVAEMKFDAARAQAFSAIEKSMLEERAREEEHRLIWSMSQSERDAYLSEKRKQVELVREQQRKKAKEEALRKERMELILSILLGVVMAAFGLFMIFLALMKSAG